MTPNQKSNEEPTQVAVAVAMGDETPKERQDHDDAVVVEEKLGRSCCGCCCDMRRAVIILSAIGIVLTGLSLVGNYYTLFEERDFNNKNEEEDYTQDEQDQLESLWNLHLGLSIGAMVCYALAIRGAISYNVRLVATNAMYLVVNFAITNAKFFATANDIDSFEWTAVNVIGPAIGFAMSLYIHISFIKEVRCGIMSPETYEREKQSCCCV